jgi:hypothetical protein
VRKLRLSRAAAVATHGATQQTINGRVFVLFTNAPPLTRIQPTYRFVIIIPSKGLDLDENQDGLVSYAFILTRYFCDTKFTPCIALLDKNQDKPG